MSGVVRPAAQDVDDLGRHHRLVDQLLDGEVAVAGRAATAAGLGERGADRPVEGNLVADRARLVASGG